MRYSAKLFAGLVYVAIIGCTQIQGNSDSHIVVENANSKKVEDPKDIESYWTEEKMQKAKPMPTPTVIIDANTPETSQPNEKLDGQGIQGVPPIAPSNTPEISK